MRKLFALLLVCMPKLLFAQLEIGINGGLSGFWEPVYQATVSRNVDRHYKAGIGYEMNSEYNGNNVPFVFADYYEDLGKGEAYAGLSAGYVIASAQSSTESPGGGFMAGLQAGYTYPFYKNFCVNVQVDARYAHVSFDNTRYYFMHDAITSAFLYFPVTIGVHYQLPNFMKHSMREAAKF